MKRLSILFAVVAGFSTLTAIGQPKQHGYFVVTLGRDTIAVEEFFMDGQGLHGTSVVRAPKTTIREYSGTFGPDGGLLRFHVASQRYGNPVFSERDYTYANDSVHITSRQDTVTTKYAVAASDRPFPFFGDIFGGWQAALQHALMMDKKKGFGILGGRQIMHYDIQGSFPGKVELLNPGGDFGPLHAVVGKDVLLDKFDMTETTDKFVATRASGIDVKEVAKTFADRERSGRALGPLSPRDSTRAMVNGASIIVDYGRPSARGRTIFGQVVPWNVVWRTGANAATQLITTKDLAFGTTVVPAGTYSLFVLPSQDGWKLIINHQHGQWGTDYDQSKDLARLPLDVKHVDDFTERFTISITSDGSRGTLSLKWEKTEASIPFTVQ